MVTLADQSSDASVDATADAGVALARAVVAHFSERRHQPLLDSEKRVRDMALALLAKPIEALPC